MSSPEAATKARTKKKAAAKKAAAHKPAASKPVAAEPTGAQKAAFAKAVLKGVKPGSEAAKSVARKKAGDAPQRAEVIRKIPASPAIAENETSKRARLLAAEIDKALRAGDLDTFQPHAQQALIGALCRLYAASNEAGQSYPAIGPASGVTATDVMVMCGALLKAVDLQVFELGLWQSWSSR